MIDYNELIYRPDEDEPVYPEGTDYFIMHMALILTQEGVTVNQARFIAWCEGPAGYDKRLWR